ncbi:formyltransferase family protein [Fulvivirgaceae bacterium BMA12]|uniref:Formyltransferase family protein n=1 Tax=Agaribacillus aureus TaxID=3051825 RepID=A0ABT8LD30_9BACT|nr:formyltransferase family protein [Fulvivirgaceae bacterium BMA12]
MKKIIIANTNNIHGELENRLAVEYGASIIHNKAELNLENLNTLNPEYIFFLHWSYIIPEEIFTGFKCVVFHMTDLPYGRGGSPLQNLIVRGHKSTRLSALQVAEGIDTGDIYLKEDLSLCGTAEEIFIRAGGLMEKMIKKIIKEDLRPTPQQGEPELFKRRKPNESSIQNLKEILDVYDYIRMLDADGYPKAFIETDHFKFEFSRASLKKDGIFADVRIFKK